MNEETVEEDEKIVKKKIGFKSLFTRLFITYVGIIIISLGIIAMFLPSVLESYFMKQKEDVMKNQGQKVARQLGVAFYTGIIGIDRLQSEFSLLEGYADSIWLIDKEGGLVAVSGDGENIEDVVIAKSELEEMFNGETIVIENRFNDIFSRSTLTVGCPIWLGETVVGGLLVHTSIPEIKESIKDVYTVFIIAILISVGIAFILLYFMAKRIVKPLKDMTEASKVIASGDFKKRIEIKSNDEIGQLAANFNEMAEGLDKMEDYRSRFIANISHDLRSPITSIQGFLNAILDGTIPPEKQEKYLHTVLDETYRLTKLTNDILELSKIENSEIVLNKENYDINEMIRNIVLKFETRVMDKKINMNVVFVHESSWVYADAQKIERIIYNLIDNAVKFTGENGIITIKTEDIDDKIYITVSDTGIGLADDEAKHIFERFYKADSSRGMDKKGMGLGLSIVKEIIKAHEEAITVDSKKGEGTSFRFSLTKSEEM